VHGNNSRSAVRAQWPGQIVGRDLIGGLLLAAQPGRRHRQVELDDDGRTRRGQPGPLAQLVGSRRGAPLPGGRQ
ncbi:MAG: hypothetical protein ACREX8_15465, partial [Gammaproteobacteria bacterium]